MGNFLWGSSQRLKCQLFVTHDIYQSIDDGLETRAIFLDISNAIDKVWHEVVLFKLKQNGILGNILMLSPISCMR